MTDQNGPSHFIGYPTLRQAQHFIERHDKEAFPAVCKYGHFGCSCTIDGGPCLDECWAIVTSALLDYLTQINTEDMQEFSELAMDQNGLCNLLSEVGEVCRMKSEHIRTNWQDEALAKHWDHMARLLENASTTASRTLP